MPLVPTKLSGDGAPPTLLFVPPGAARRCRWCCSATARICRKMTDHANAGEGPVSRRAGRGRAHGLSGPRRTTGRARGRRRGVRRRRPTPDERCEQLRASRATIGSQWSAARAADERITGSTGYAGFSMGAMFGLAIVADLPSVVSAVFALGGLTTNPQRDALIRAGAGRLTDHNVLMLNMTRRRTLSDRCCDRALRVDSRSEADGSVVGDARRHPTGGHRTGDCAFPALARRSPVIGSATGGTSWLNA